MQIKVQNHDNMKIFERILQKQWIFEEKFTIKMNTFFFLSWSWHEPLELYNLILCASSWKSLEELWEGKDPPRF